MFKRKPIIRYESAVNFYNDVFIAAKKNIPDWYKKKPKWKNNEMFTVGEGFNVTIKHCMPFLDSL